MSDSEKYFEMFAGFVESWPGRKSALPSFGDVCSAIGAPEGELDACVFGKFGIGGEDVLRSLRTSTPILFL